MTRNLSTAVIACLSFIGCHDAASTSDLAAAGDTRHLFMDIHELGPGNVRAEYVAEAHLKDLAFQDSLDVNFLNYWVDEKNGRIYCLVRAPSSNEVRRVHSMAHGSEPENVFRVEGGEEALLRGSRKLYLDVHLLGAGNVDPDAVAIAHRKDVDVQDSFGVNFINYWVDEAGGRIVCLSEAPDSMAVIKTHHAAHGLLPESVSEVIQGE